MRDLLADLVRGGHYVAVVALFGGFIFRLAVAQPALRAAGPDADARRSVDAFLSRLAAGNLLLAMITGALWLWLNAAEMSATPFAAALSWPIFGAVLTETGFGHLWQFRCAIALLVGALLVGQRMAAGRASASVFAAAGALLSGILVASLAFAGHAMDDRGMAHLWHLGADLCHLLAAGGWVGALPPLAFVLWRANATGSQPWLGVAQQATARFSTLGIATVTTLIATGAINAWYLVGSVPGLFGTLYGQLLLIKLALFAGMLALAAANRLRLAPRLYARGTGPEAVRDAARRLCRNAVAEGGSGVLLLLVVGALVHQVPAAHTEPAWPFPVTLDPAAPANLAGPRLALLAFLGIASIGLVIAAIALHRWRRPLAGAAGTGLAVLAFLGLRPFVIEAFPTTYMRSPVPYDAPAIARGMAAYDANCAACHGPQGHGDGPAAAGLPVKLADLTGVHLHQHSDGTLFWWISHGIPGTSMPGVADRLNNTERWELLAFLRAQADAESANTMTEVAEPPRPVVAPDFAFQIGRGSQQTLKQQRGRCIVLLVLFTDPGALHDLDAATGEIEAAGARIIALPMAKGRAAAETAPEPPSSHLQTAESGPETVSAYSLFAGQRSGEVVSPMPPRVEFLIDRQGYLRFRSLPAETAGSDDVRALLRRIEFLNGKPARPPTPPDHAH